MSKQKDDSVTVFYSIGDRLKSEKFTTKAAADAFLAKLPKARVLGKITKDSKHGKH